MQPISIVGPGAAALAGDIAGRFDGRVAVVTCDQKAADGGIAAPREAMTAANNTRTAISLADDGTWGGTGTVEGIDELLDGLAPEHDYLVIVGKSRLRVPVVLLGDDGTSHDDVPGTVVATGASPDEIDLDELVANIDTEKPWITRETLVSRVEADADADRAGAIATFTGRVRARDAPDDDRTTHLAFEKYEGVAADRMEMIAAELSDRNGVFDVRMHHRTGVIEAGEDIVFVVVLAGHRREAFRAVEDGIDRLKDEVPIFKKESTETEEFWVHQRE